MEKIVAISLVSSAVVFLIAFGLGFGTAFFVFHKNNAENMPPTSAEETEADSTTDMENTSRPNHQLVASPSAFALSVNDQLPGESVVIAEATLAEEAWIAVHEVIAEKTLGRILGAQLFPQGTTRGTVELLRETEAGNTYRAVVHWDDGDREFDFETDRPFTNPLGDMFSDSFQTVLPTSPHEYE